MKKKHDFNPIRMLEVVIYELKDEDMTTEELEDALDKKMSDDTFTHVVYRDNKFFLDDNTLIAIVTPNKGDIAIPTSLLRDEENEAIVNTIKKFADPTDRVLTIPF